MGNRDKSVHELLTQFEFQSDPDSPDAIDLFIEPPAIEEDRASVIDDASETEHGDPEINSLPAAILRRPAKLTSKHYNRGKEEDSETDNADSEEDLVLGDLCPLKKPDWLPKDLPQQIQDEEFQAAEPIPLELDTSTDLTPYGNQLDEIHPISDAESEAGNANDNPVGYSTPSALFEQFFDDHLLSLIVVETLRYAHEIKGDLAFTLLQQEFRVFLAILMCSGYLPICQYIFYQCKTTFYYDIAEMERNDLYYSSRY